MAMLRDKYDELWQVLQRFVLVVICFRGLAGNVLTDEKTDFFNASPVRLFLSSPAFGFSVNRG
jgi:hypothetical protein